MTYVPADTPVVPEWWPEPDTAADAEYASRTYGVVRWVYRQNVHKLYPVSVDNCAELRADLLSWLIVRAMEFRAGFVPDPARFKPGEPDPQLTQWLQVLRAAMTKAVKWHYNNTQVPAGLHPLEARTPTYSTRSVEEPARANGSSSTRASLREGDVRTLGDIGHSLWYAGESLQPEVHYLTVEGLWDRVERLTGTRRTGSYEQAVHALDSLVPDAPPGQCEVFGCDRKVQAKRLCSAHYAQQRKANMPPCSVEGCEQNQTAKGLCDRHYKQRQGIGAPPCTVEGCDNPTRSNGLCNAHYQRARTDKIAERLGVTR